MADFGLVLLTCKLGLPLLAVGLNGSMCNFCREGGATLVTRLVDVGSLTIEVERKSVGDEQA